MLLRLDSGVPAQQVVQRRPRDVLVDRVVQQHREPDAEAHELHDRVPRGEVVHDVGRRVGRVEHVSGDAGGHVEDGTLGVRRRKHRGGAAELPRDGGRGAADRCVRGRGRSAGAGGAAAARPRGGDDREQLRVVREFVVDRHGLDVAVVREHHDRDRRDRADAEVEQDDAVQSVGDPVDPQRTQRLHHDDPCSKARRRGIPRTVELWSQAGSHTPRARPPDPPTRDSLNSSATTTVDIGTTLGSSTKRSLSTGTALASRPTDTRVAQHTAGGTLHSTQQAARCTAHCVPGDAHPRGAQDEHPRQRGRLSPGHDASTQMSGGVACRCRAARGCCTNQGRSSTLRGMCHAWDSGARAVCCVDRRLRMVPGDGRNATFAWCTRCRAT